MHWLVTLMVCCLLTGCANVQPERVVLPAFNTLAPEIELPDEDLLAMTDSMKAFVQRHVIPYNNRRKRADALTQAIYNRGGFAFEYQEDQTFTAAEAFANHGGNCIAFTHLFIAMAREAGLPARYQQVDVPDNWNPRAGLLVKNRHVNAVMREPGGTYVVDINKRFIPREGKMQVISDQEAAAKHYNNLSVAALFDGDLPLAYAYSKKALSFDQQQGYIWSNLGLIYKRNQQLQDARWAFAQALEASPAEASAIKNLIITYRELGQPARAKQLAVRHKRLLAESPYNLYERAIIALKQADFNKAKQLLKRAIRKKRSEHKFHFVLAKAYYELGDTDRADRSFEQAKATASIALLNSFYKASFAELMQHELSAYR